MQNNRTIKVRWKEHRLREVLLVFTCSFALIGCSRSRDIKRERPDVISREQAIEDLDFLVKKLKKMHPNPFERISEEQFQKELQELKSSLDSEVKAKDFSLSISRLLALLRDSHTTHEDFSYFQEHKSQGGKVFPVRFRYQDGHMRVEAWSPDIEPNKLNRGEVVLSVNGESMESLLRRYGACISAEADLQRHWKLEGKFSTYLFLLGDTSSHYTLALQNSDGQTYKITLPEVNPWLHLYEQTRFSCPLFSHKFYGDGKICLFKAQSFANKLSRKIKQRTNAIISEMRKRNTEILIFDLRGNGGGNGGLGAEVVNKVIDRKFDADFRPHRNAYHCELVLLCNRRTHSAASWVATYVKDYRIGIIAGEETGGRACFYGNIRQIGLPNSGLRCGIGTRFFMRPAGYNDRKGVHPDLPLDVRANDETIVEKITTYLSSSGN